MILHRQLLNNPSFIKGIATTKATEVYTAHTKIIICSEILLDNQIPNNQINIWVISSVGLERPVDIGEVAGSNPVSPTFYCLIY